MQSEGPRPKQLDRMLAALGVRVMAADLGSPKGHNEKSLMMFGFIARDLYSCLQ